MANLVPARVIDADATPHAEIRALFQVVKGIVGDQNTYTEDGAIAVTSRYVALDASEGALSMTLAAPGADDKGRVMTIELVDDDSNGAVLALTNVDGGSGSATATFDAVGETLVIVGTDTAWTVVAEVGVTLADP